MPSLFFLIFFSLFEHWFVHELGIQTFNVNFALDLFFSSFFSVVLKLLGSISRNAHQMWTCITLRDLFNGVSFIPFQVTSENFHNSQDKFWQRPTLCVPALRITFMALNPLLYQYLFVISSNTTFNTKHNIKDKINLI